MATLSDSTARTGAEVRDSWVPMIVIALGQMLMSFNVAAIPVSMSGMVESFNTPPTTVGTAVVLYSLGVSGFIMLGAKLGQRFGSKVFFQTAAGLFLLAMVTIVLSPTAEIMLAGQGLAGFAGAALVPTLVVLIADHYRGKQQAEAVGWLGSARAIAGVLAFIIVGSVATWLSWRWAFGLLIVHSAVLLLLSFQLKPSRPKPDVKIDLIGVLLSSAAVICIIFGFNNLRTWGVLLARPAAPFDLVGVSPAPALIVVGVAILAAFVAWSHRQASAGKTPLIALEVVDSPREWMTVVALFAIVAMEGAINFSVPLYIQIVQGSPAFQTSIAMMPFMLTVFFTAILIVRLYKRFTPRQIATGAFLLVAAGTAWLATVVRNDWSVPPVIAGLIVVGLGQGALVTLLFNVLVTASPKELAGDVGALRGVTQNLAAAVGTAVVGAVLVGLLSTMIIGQLNQNPVITAELKDEVNLTNLNFMSDVQIKERLGATSATPDQLEEALRINAEARIRALKVGFLCLTGLALLSLFPCRWLPNYRPDEIPST
ncbi:MFS transporter [Planctomicrobium piriforme]|uniref:Predicted arabinose efflux permease, MFS family n=1 Tax=Planctomicrobium piriforme TaxID=1576369 RepID=A0A1I3PX79_9PLAN|nr:MFS transporter [Planctomicrobium piriforme]SFJ26454.1 Predicted arabinose efflux permease, MFS family [Planctomicrobium piriforme]